MKTQSNQQAGNKPELIMLEHLRMERDKKRDCQCAVPHFSFDPANKRYRCLKCRSLMEAETVVDIMIEKVEDRNEQFQSAYNQAVKNIRLAEEAKAEKEKLEKEAQALRKEIAELKKTLGAI